MREKEREREPKTEATMYCNLTLKVTYCHLCHILLVTQTNTGTVWGGDSRRMLIPGGGDHWGIILEADHH